MQTIVHVSALSRITNVHSLLSDMDNTVISIMLVQGCKLLGIVMLGHLPSLQAAIYAPLLPFVSVAGASLLRAACMTAPAALC